VQRLCRNFIREDVASDPPDLPGVLDQPFPFLRLVAHRDIVSDLDGSYQIAKYRLPEAVDQPEA